MQTRARRAVDSAASNIPDGTLAVGAGLLIGSVAAWAYQIFAEKKLSDSGYNAVNSLWILTFVITPGFFQPLEQEVARSMAHRREHGQGGGPVLWKAVRLGAALAAVTATIVLGVFIFVPNAIDQLFKKDVSTANHWMLIGALIVALMTYASAYLVRGALSGNGRFNNYGLMHGSEGITRVIAVVAIVASGHATPGLFGLALVLPPIVAVLVSLRGQKGLAAPGPEASYSELSTALAWLLSSSVMAQVLSYAPVFAAQILMGPGKEDQRLLAGFVTAMFLARVPLLMFQAVQAALLPKLAASAAAGRHDEFSAVLKRLFVLVLGIGVAGVIGALALGQPVGQRIFAKKWTLSSPELALLAAGAGAYIVAFTLAQGLIALKAYSKLTIGWAVGAIGFVSVMPFGSDVITRAQLAFLASSVLAAVTITALLFREMKTTTATVEDLLEVISHEPLEL